MANEDQVLYKECRFAIYCGKNSENNDMHVVKEIVHLKDGTSYPNLKTIPNFKRDFYITKPGKRNHQQKKEWEKLENLDRYQSLEADLAFNISRALNRPWERLPLKKVCRDPYVYGADITSTAIIKHKYNEKYKGKITPYSVAVFDLETDELNNPVTGAPTKLPVIGSVTMRNKAYTAVTKDFVKGYHNVIEKLHELKEKHLGHIVNDRDIDWTIEIVDNDLEIVTRCMAFAHKLKPDFLAIWNMKFDIGKVLEVLHRHGVDPKFVFTDPEFLKKYPEHAFFDYIIGPDKKVTASGLITPIKPAAQWHTVLAPSSFYVIDSMCAYRHIRITAQEEPSYALNNILATVFKDKPEIRKLSFEEANAYSGLEWHQFMQEFYPLQYTIYNFFDDIGVEKLDEKTIDLRVTLPMFSGICDFKNFNSQPKRLATGMHFYLINKSKKVMGTTSDEMITEDDKLLPSLGGWITALAPHNLLENGLRCIKDFPNLVSNIHTHVAD